MDHIWTNLNGLTQSAIIVITLIAIVFHVRWTRRNTALGPTFLTTLGIFFCFIGIAWGLLNFDPADIRAGIPHLLEGIRTSFWASVTGIFWALTIKGRVALMGDGALAATGAQRGANHAGHDPWRREETEREADGNARQCDDIRQTLRVVVGAKEHDQH